MASSDNNMKNTLVVISAIFGFAFLIGGCVLALHIAHPTKKMSFWTRGLFNSQETRDRHKAARDAAAEKLGGVKEANKTHYWNGSVFVEGPAPSHRDK